MTAPDHTLRRSENPCIEGGIQTCMPVHKRRARAKLGASPLDTEEGRATPHVDAGLFVRDPHAGPRVWRENPPSRPFCSAKRVTFLRMT